MAASDVESRIVVPFHPTLTDMSLARTALALYSDFDIQVILKAFSDTTFGSSKVLEDSSLDSPFLLMKVKEKTLLVPTKLRKYVLEAALRLQDEVQQWMHDHRDISGMDNKNLTFVWRPDGTIDREKTAEELVGYQTINIKSRFQMACKYCLVNSIQTLWSELEENGETEIFDSPYNGIVFFWITWMREIAHVPWTQYAEENLDPQWFLIRSVPRFASIFKALKPGSRTKLFKYLYLSDDDDIRSCLYIVNQEEQEIIMTLLASRVLGIHMKWPHASLFLETARKAWKFLNNSSYFSVLRKLLSYNNVSDIDYQYLAFEFMNHSPEHFHETAIRCVEMSVKREVE